MMGFLKNINLVYFPEEKLPDPARDFALGEENDFLEELEDFFVLADFLGGVLAPGVVPVDL